MKKISVFEPEDIAFIEAMAAALANCPKPEPPPQYDEDPADLRRWLAGNLSNTMTGD